VASRRPCQTLALLTALMGRYFECRASIYHSLTFVLHYIPTLHSVVVTKDLPIINVIRFMNLAVLFRPWRNGSKLQSPSAAIVKLWRQCCSALVQAENLVSINL
jgi:hypothetical protein